MSLSVKHFREIAEVAEGIQFFQEIDSHHFFTKSSFFGNLKIDSYLPVDL